MRCMPLLKRMSKMALNPFCDETLHVFMVYFIYLFYYFVMQMKNKLKLSLFFHSCSCSSQFRCAKKVEEKKSHG